MNKKVIFTYITGDYDKLIEPEVITPGWDYVCFSDNPKLKSRNWDVRPLHTHDQDIECPKRRANAIVMKYYEYISDHYDICIIIDGNIKISKNLDTLLSDFEFDRENIDLMIGQHPTRDCVYDEAKEIVKLQKDDANNIIKHVKILQREGYPYKNGLCETCVFIISRKSKKCIGLFSEWYDTYMSLPSKRDQMTFDYTMWKNKEKKLVCPNITVYERNESGKTPREKKPFNDYLRVIRSHK